MPTEQFAIAEGDKVEPDKEPAILGYDGAESNALDVPMQYNYEKKAADNVDDVDEDGNPHRQTRVLHTDKPSFDGIKSQSGGGCPNPDEEVAASTVESLALETDSFEAAVETVLIISPAVFEERV